MPKEAVSLMAPCVSLPKSARLRRRSMVRARPAAVRMGEHKPVRPS